MTVPTTTVFDRIYRHAERRPNETASHGCPIVGRFGCFRSKKGKCDDFVTARALARQSKPKVSYFVPGRRGSLVDIHGGSKGSLQHRIVNASKMPFENRRSFRIVEREDSFAHFFRGSAKEGRSPLQAARVDLIGQSKRRQLIFCIERDRKAQKKQQPLAHLPAAPIQVTAAAVPLNSSSPSCLAPRPQLPTRAGRASHATVDR
jgi:hypothetical protein